MMDKSRYKTHIYSRLPQFSETNDLDENRVLTEVTTLQLAWDQDNGLENKYSGESVREYFEESLQDDQVVIVLIEDLVSRQMVGFGELASRLGQPSLSLAYVLPGHRRRGIYEQIIDARCDAAVKIGYESLITYPSDDGESARVLRRKGFLPAKDKDGADILRIKFRQLREGNGHPPGMPPSSIL